MPKSYQEWRAQFVELASKQWDGTPMEGDLYVRMTFCCKGKLRPDLDNAIGAALDALQDTGVFANDRAVKKVKAVAVEHHEQGDSLLITIDQFSLPNL